MMPTIIEWLMHSGVILRSLFGPVADIALSRDGEGTANYAVCGRAACGRPGSKYGSAPDVRRGQGYIRVGAKAWRADLQGDWQPIDKLPPEWGLLPPVDPRGGGHA